MQKVTVFAVSNVVLYGYRVDESRFSDVCLPAMPDDSCHVDIFSPKRAYCVYLLLRVNIYPYVTVCT